MPSRSAVEREIRQWLSSHHGVIGRYEAMRLGMTADMIRYKLDQGEWFPLHRTVYRDTAVPRTTYQDLRGACVATRGLGVVSHASAGWLWGLLPVAPDWPELSIPPGSGIGRGLEGLTIHRSKDLELARAVIRQMILVTNPLRTIVDLAGTVSTSDLTDAVDSALARKLVTIAGLTAELGRLGRQGRPGVGALRLHLRDRGFTGAPQPSVLEAKMGRIIIATRLPLPTVELQVDEEGRYRLDFAWPHLLLSIEVDGYLWHFSPDHKQRDDTRRNHLQAAGWTVLVYNWREVCDEPARLAAEIASNYHKLNCQPSP